ncbi:disulfide bond formation protein DsbA [Allopusillimonas ginsengisoli]|nr:disulfide bond formation protein DsbA [Allopusillimonas ginsengisoli]
MKKQTVLVLTSILAVMVFSISGFVYEQSQVRKKAQLASTKTTEFERMHSPVYGPADAKVTIVEFFDPACESCRAFYPAVKQLVNVNGGKVKLVLRYAPFHEGSEEVAKILEASRLQDKYWSTLETVLDIQPQWASHDNPQVNLIWGYLKALDLDIDQVRKDMSNPTIAAIVDQDKVDLRALQVTQTPTFFVNGKPLPKFGFEQLKTLVEQEVKIAYKK